MKSDAKTAERPPRGATEDAPVSRRARPRLGGALSALLALLWAAPLLAQGIEPTEADPAEPAEPAKAQGDEPAEARRKRLARLGTGRISLPEPIGEVYGLGPLVERGLEANPQLVARKHAELFAGLRQDEADWAYAPKFELTSALTAVPAEADFNEVGTNLESFFELDIGPLSTSSLKVLVPIYSFGKLAAAVDLAELGVDQAALETEEQRLKIITQIREAYYSVQLGKTIQATMADGLAIMQEEIERLNEAREFGDEEVDVVALRKLQMTEADIAARLVDNDRLIRLAKASLGVLVQLDPAAFDVPAFDEDVDTSVLLPLARYQSLALEHRVDLNLLSKAVRARELQVDLAFADFLPDVFFALDFSLGVSTEEAPNQKGFVVAEGGNLPLEVEPLSDPYNFTRLGFVVGLRLKLDPANQTFKYKEAKAKLAETRALQEAAIGGVALDIEKSWVEADDERRKIEILDRKFKAADRWRKQVAVSFESGGASLNDFLLPLKAYYEARLSLLAARYSFRVAMAKLGQKVGLTDVEALALDPGAP